MLSFVDDPRAAELLGRLRTLIATVRAEYPSTADADRLAFDGARLLQALHQQDHARAEMILAQLDRWLTYWRNPHATTVYLYGYAYVVYGRYRQIGQLVYLGRYRNTSLNAKYHMYRLDVAPPNAEPPSPEAWERAVDADDNIFRWNYTDDSGGMALTDALIMELGTAGVQARALVRALLAEHR